MLCSREPLDLVKIATLANACMPLGVSPARLLRYQDFCGDAGACLITAADTARLICVCPIRFGVIMCAPAAH